MFKISGCSPEDWGFFVGGWVFLLFFSSECNHVDICISKWQCHTKTVALFVDFDKNYFSPACKLGIYSAQSSSILSTPALNITEPTSFAPLVLGRCQRDVSLLYILLMLGTLVLGVTLFKFTKTQVNNFILKELEQEHIIL